MRFVILAITLSAAALVGCNEEPPARTVLDPQVKALEKARAVDDQVQEAAERRKKQAEQPEQIPSGY